MLTPIARLLHAGLAPLALQKCRANHSIAQDIFVLHALDYTVVASTEPSVDGITLGKLPILAVAKKESCRRLSVTTLRNLKVVDSRHKHLIKWFLETLSPSFLTDLMDPIKVSIVCELSRICAELGLRVANLCQGYRSPPLRHSEAPLSPPARHDFGLQPAPSVRVVSAEVTTTKTFCQVATHPFASCVTPWMSSSASLSMS